MKKKLTQGVGKGKIGRQNKGKSPILREEEPKYFDRALQLGKRVSFWTLGIPSFAGAERKFFSRAVVFSGKDLCLFFEFQGRRVLHLMHPTFGMFGVSLFSSVSMEKKNMEI